MDTTQSIQTELASARRYYASLQESKMKADRILSSTRALFALFFVVEGSVLGHDLAQDLGLGNPAKGAMVGLGVGALIGAAFLKSITRSTR
jgi:hypothetical protein